MAENLGLKVEVGANIAPLQKGLADARKELSNTAIAAQKTDSSLKVMGAGLSSAGGLAKTAAANISGLASSLVSGGLITAVTLAGVALFELGKKLFDVSEEQKKLGEALESGRGVYVKTALDINKVKDALNQAKEGTITKERALGIYNKTLGATLGYTKDFNTAEENTIKNGPELLRYTLLKAAANYALAKSAEFSAKILEEEVKEARKANIFERIGGSRFGGPTPEQLKQKRINDLKKDQTVWDKIINKLQTETDEIAGRIKIKEEGIVVAIKRKTAAVKEYIEVINTAATIKGLESGFDKTPLSLASGGTIEPTIVVKPLVTFDNSALDSAFKSWETTEFKERLANMQVSATTAINQTIANIMDDTISGLAEGIAGALTNSGDGLSGIFDNLIKGIGSQITDLGKYLVKIGLEMLGAKKAIETLGLTPQGAIIAGFGLQILGSLLKAAATKKVNQTGFATGVRDLQQGGFYDVGERGRERVFLPKGSSVVPNNEMNAYGGGNTVFIPAVSLRGSDLVIAFNRAQQAMSRNG